MLSDTILGFVLGLTSHILWNFYVAMPAFFMCIMACSLSELFAEISKEIGRDFADGRGVGRSVQESGVRQLKHNMILYKIIWLLFPTSSALLWHCQRQKKNNK